MDYFDLVEKPPGISVGALLACSAERRVEGTARVVATGSGAVHLGVEEVACQTTKADDCADAKISPTSLQRMIQEILDPLALQKRPVKEWRSLYKSFFGFFDLNGVADETEKKAWAIASAAFNTNLVVGSNRTSQVVPMTFQDFVEAVDSFRQDGLREGAQRDIVWQPKKILLLMAAMIGRILAGWQADAGWPR
jgi:hypothetical protein